MTRDLVSIIVPVYNSERYIGDCVESVLRQTYECFELLLVDDGSQDRSREYCEKLCRRDSRVHLFSQGHRGVSAARNAGMRRARGGYLFFLDSDDVIHPQLLEALYRQQKAMQAEIASAGVCRTGESYAKIQKNWMFSSLEEQKGYYLDSREALRQFCAGDRKTMLYAIGGKLIRREAVRGMRF